MPDFNGNGVDDVEDVRGWLAKRCQVCAAAWMTLADAVRGVKTLSLSLTVMLISTVDELGGIDLLQTLRYQLQDENPKLGRWLFGLAAAYLLLRAFTTTPMFGGKKEASESDEGETQ